jgi:Phosphotransferase system, mannitol-specific IIBC component
MGSSAMGAGIFRKKVEQAGRDDLTVVHAAIEAIPADTDVVIVHRNLADRARSALPNTELVTIENFLGDPALERLREQLTEGTNHEN